MYCPSSQPLYDYVMIRLQYYEKRANVMTLSALHLHSQHSELCHISGVRTHIQKVKPKMAEFEEL